MERTITRGAWMAVVVVVVGCSALAGGVTDDYGFEWATIGDVGNPAYRTNANLNHAPDGRGSVNYTYRISRMETTTAQFMEFTNTFDVQPGAYGGSFYSQYIHRPSLWGAHQDYLYSGPGLRFELDAHPDAARRPMGGITWVTAAAYTNWLHNGKSSDFDDLYHGAYDFSDPSNIVREDGAKYWLPTVDEWLKAAHWDPTKDGVGGWWQHTNQSDELPTPGMPGDPGAETSAGLILPGDDEWLIPLGAYPDTSSYYGLLDLAGGGHEWMEDWVDAEPPDFHRYRYFDGLSAETGQYDRYDDIDKLGWMTPSPYNPFNSFRIVSAVPSPGAAVLLIVAGGSLAIPRRRKACRYAVRSHSG